MIYKMALKDSTDEMTFNLLEVPIVDKDIEGAVDNVTLDGNQYTDYLYLKKQFIQKWSIMCDEEYERLRGFYTRQFDEAEIPTYELYYGETIYNDYTLSGEYIYADVQGVEPARMSLAQLNGNATQTTYSGINIFATSDSIWAGTSAGKVTYSATNDDFTFSRPAGADFLIANGSLALKPSTTYTIMFDVSQNTMTDAFRLATTSSCIQTSTLSITAGTTGKFYGKLVTRASLTQTYDIWFFCNSAGNTLKAKIMLVEGDYNSVTFPAYEPFTNGASPNPSYPQPISVVTGENVVKVVGKNLFSGFATLATGSTFANDTLTMAVSATNASNDFTVQGSTAYYLNFDTPNQTRVYIREYDASGTMLVNTTKYVPYGFTTNANTAFVRIYFAPSTSESFPVTVKDIQLELGSTATSYQAYTEQDYTINLGSTELAKIGTYQDRIYKTDGKWYVEKNVGKTTLDGSEAYIWNYNSGTYSGFYRAVDTILTDGIAKVDDARLSKSNNFTCESTTTTWTGAGKFGFSSTWTMWFELMDNTITTYRDFNTWLSTHPTTIYYPLATPTTTEITDQTLIDQLEALINVSIATGIHNIFTEVASGNLNPTMIFNFIEVVSRRVTLVPETPVRLTLTDGGIINACGCRKDVQLTMRETIE